MYGCHSFSSVKENEDLSCLKTDYCMHSIVANIIWSTDDLDPGNDASEEEFVEVLDTHKNYAALVVPSIESVTKPGVVFLTAKMLKPRCDKCLGKTCCHLTVHKVKYDEQENVDTEIDPKYKLKISPDGLKELTSGKTTGNTSNDTNTTIEKDI